MGAVGPQEPLTGFGQWGECGPGGPGTRRGCQRRWGQAGHMGAGEVQRASRAGAVSLPSREVILGTWTVGDRRHGDQGACPFLQSMLPLALLPPLGSRSVLLFIPSAPSSTSLQGSTLFVADAREIWGGQEGDTQAGGSPAPR